MKTLHLLLLPALLSIFACSTTQYYSSPTLNQSLYPSEGRGSQPAFSKPGSCYAKCLIGDRVEAEEVKYPVYIGDNPDQANVVKEKIVLKESSSKWVKKKANRNCISADPNDCMVWCMVNTPEESIDLLIVKDIEQMDEKDYAWETFLYDVPVSKGGYTEWHEVLCNDKVTASTVEQIQEALIERQFYDGELSGQIDVKTKSALTNFQKKNGLPIGNLDLYTLEELAINF